MKTITDKLADALRTIDEHCQTGLNSSVYSHWCAALEDSMRVSREAIAAYDAFMLGVAEAHSDVTTHVSPDLIETYDAGRASVRGVED